MTFCTRTSSAFLSGVRSGVNGTPTFDINGVRHDDSYKTGALLAAVQRAAPQSNPPAALQARNRR